MQDMIKNIENDGFCIIPGLYNRDTINKALELVKKLNLESQDDSASDVPFLNRDTQMVYNLQNKNFYFLDLLFGKEDLQKILIHFLNDTWFKQIPQTDPNYILRSYMARSSNNRLPMHIDSFVPYKGPFVFIMQMAIILEDQSEENGCTVVVPGSHQAGQYVEQIAFKDAVPVISKAGDVVIWDSRLWHAALENTTEGTRWSIIATFSRWWVKQFFNLTRSLPQDIYKRLTDSQKAILGFCSIPYDEESQGVDMKKGYDALSDDVARYQK